MAVDLGKVTPPIPDAGGLLDNLIGSWVDQTERNRFSLSPLLSNYAATTLTRDEKVIFQSALAASLTKGRRLHVTDANSALLAAWSSKNKAVIMKLCMAVLGSDQGELEMLAPHLSMFTLFRTDTLAYPDDAVVSHIFRGVQLLLLNQKNASSPEFHEALDCFAREAKNVEDCAMRSTMNLLIYSKLLLHDSKVGIGVDFIAIISELEQLIANESDAIPSEALKGMGQIEEESVTAIGLMFLSQVRQLTKIDELAVVFDFLGVSSTKLRTKLLAPFEHEDFDIDILLTGAWLSEHNQNTIVPQTHAAIFARLEEQARSWGHSALAVSCRKYRVIILDEYGNDEEHALAAVNEGLSLYGRTNSELLRAKAKVLYRSENHKESLALSKLLIESDSNLRDVEKAYLGRDTAISAEKQGDFKMARQFYLYGSDAAKNCDLPDMTVMQVGLMADAGLAAWHQGDRQSCLQDFATVLNELNKFKPAESLRATHCHAAVRHVILWLDQEARGEKHLLNNGEETKIYPGCISNPEPHQDIGTGFIAPIEMAWYMLATVENYAVVDAGITENLDTYLPNGSVIEGQMLLIYAKMHNALACLNKKLFVESLSEIVAILAFVQANGGHQNAFDIKDVTYGTLPKIGSEQGVTFREATEQLILVYCANCVFKKAAAEIPAVIEEITGFSGISVRQELLDSLQNIDAEQQDFNVALAQLTSSECFVLHNADQGVPRNAFEFALKSLQLAQLSGHYNLISNSLLPWLEQRWKFVWERQRFLLSSPLLHADSIEAAIKREGATSQTKVTEILHAVLPTLGISNQHKVEQIIKALPKS